ncbi:MAG TPA: branched-chain amino acid ABC transporter permease [Acidimicrobiales bacterium]|jgi:branched-chain amino acid transport system permease protein|nr:branched-chain amino acid ABC transporter permease [Acidimicrobiales bacterium]|tara:strand:+ start:8366 stop:9550 length:1185 start_codon:yes stop_codon:yes gene_type:complete
MAPKITLTRGTPQYRNLKILMWVSLILFFLLIAFAYVDVGSIAIGSNKYNLSLIRLNKAIAYSVAILGLQVVVGYTGQIALGQSFFFGTGAYISAWLVADYSWPFLLTLVIVIPSCFLIGMILGLPALRIRGLYLALLTLGLAALFPTIVKLDSLYEYTGGAGGKLTTNKITGSQYKFSPPSWLPLDEIAQALQNIPLVGGYFGDGPLSNREESRMWKFILFSLVAALCFWLISNLIKSKPGRAMRAVRDNETSAAVSGVNLAMTKTISFGIASALGGIGGMIYVAEVGIASPDDFSSLVAIYLIVGLVVGGVGTLSGAVIGGLVYALIPDWASSTQSISFVPQRWLQGPTGSLILGLLLIVLTLFMPGGISTAAKKVKNRFVTIQTQSKLSNS